MGIRRFCDTGGGAVMERVLTCSFPGTMLTNPVKGELGGYPSEPSIIIQQRSEMFEGSPARTRRPSFRPDNWLGAVVDDDAIAKEQGLLET
jgi:hypothetical protein